MSPPSVAPTAAGCVCVCIYKCEWLIGSCVSQQALTCPQFDTSEDWCVSHVSVRDVCLLFIDEYFLSSSFPVVWFSCVSQCSELHCVAGWLWETVFALLYVDLVRQMRHLNKKKAAIITLLCVLRADCWKSLVKWNYSFKTCFENTQMKKIFFIFNKMCIRIEKCYIKSLALKTLTLCHIKSTKLTTFFSKKAEFEAVSINFVVVL